MAMPNVDPNAETAVSDTQASGSSGTAATLSIGARLADRYVVRAFLGEGGMGAVYRALDEKLEEDVALKVMRGAFATSELLRDEVRLAQRVTHPNVCRTYDLEEVDGLQLVKMEYVPGEPLSRVLARDGRLSIDRAVAIARQLAAGLAAAHAQGIVHRDLKPANIMLVGDRAVLMDFGLAQRVSAKSNVAGTPGYMPPEQLAGAEINQTTDLYALGCVLYEMLAGERVFEGSAIELAAKHASTKAPDLRTKRREVPSWLANAVAQLLAKRAGERTAGLRWLAGPRPRRWPIVLAGGALAAAIAAIAWRGHHGAADWSPEVEDLPRSPEAGTPMVFSPDGTQLAYVSNRGGVNQLVLHHLAHGSERMIAGGWGDPAWTRDGKALLVARGNHVFRLPLDAATPIDLGPGTTSADCGDVIVTRVDDPSGTRFEALEPGGRRVIYRAPASLFAARPTCDATGKRFLVAIGLTVPEHCTGDLFIVDRSGGEPRKVTSGGAACSGSFTPDGQSIVYAARRDGRVQIYAQPAAGDDRSAHRVTFDDGRDLFPDVSVDGLLAFTRVQLATTIFAGAGAAPSEPLQLAAGTFDAIVPTRDGTHPLVARTTVEDGMLLDVVDVASGSERRLAAGTWPYPSSDDSRVFFPDPEHRERLMAVPFGGGTPVEVARFPGTIVIAHGATDGAYALVATPRGLESYSADPGGALIQLQSDGLAIPAGHGGWRLIERPGEHIELGLNPPLTPPSLIRWTVTSTMLASGWIDDRRVAYANGEPNAFHVIDAETGEDRRVTTDRTLRQLSAIAADGVHWFTTEDDNRGTRHIMTNFGDRPWR